MAIDILDFAAKILWYLETTTLNAGIITLVIKIDCRGRIFQTIYVTSLDRKCSVFQCSLERGIVLVQVTPTHSELGLEGLRLAGLSAGMGFLDVAPSIPAARLGGLATDACLLGDRQAQHGDAAAGVERADSVRSNRRHATRP